jgi:hypothetical protein
MADVSMAIWGKDAGGRAAAAHLVYVGCVGICGNPKQTQKTLNISFLPQNVTLICKFVPSVSNILVWFMSTGCVTG